MCPRRMLCMVWRLRGCCEWEVERKIVVYSMRERKRLGQRRFV